MQLFIIIIFIIAFALIVSFLDEKRTSRTMRYFFQHSYGQKPDDNNHFADNQEEIKLYYNLIKETIPAEELVDDITWNDLEMDKIFTRINTTVSYAGEQFLFSELHKTPQNKRKAEARERRIHFFETENEKRLKTQCFLHKLSKESIHFYIPECVQTLDTQKIPFIQLYKFLFCSLLCLILGAIITGNTWLTYAVGINFLINLALYALNKMKYEFYLDSLYGIIHTIKIGKSLSDLYDDTELSAQPHIKNLNKISNIVLLLEHKKQMGFSGDILGLVSDYILGALMWDFILYDKVTKLLFERKEDFFSIYEFVGEIDLCIAVASFRKSLEYYCIPEFSEKDFAMTGLYHPLIENAIKNDFHMEKNIILTGSNASGKSTFIKASCINLILGQSIHTCTAQTMILPDVKILTSMSVRDDISSGESYYMKEIKYLYRIIKDSCGKRLLFCGIDEILRGTNTKERIAASLAILQYLSKANCLLMVATHDLELATSLDNVYDNYYFCESVQNGDVVFDYKLRQGICNSYNAIRLLESIGFPKEIIEEAKKGIKKKE